MFILHVHKHYDLSHLNDDYEQIYDVSGVNHTLGHFTVLDQVLPCYIKPYSLSQAEY